MKLYADDLVEEYGGLVRCYGPLPFPPDEPKQWSLLPSDSEHWSVLPEVGNVHWVDDDHGFYATLSLDDEGNPYLTPGQEIAEDVHEGWLVMVPCDVDETALPLGAPATLPLPDEFNVIAATPSWDQGDVTIVTHGVDLSDELKAEIGKKIQENMEGLLWELLTGHGHPPEADKG